MIDIKSCPNTGLVGRYQYEVTKVAIGFSGDTSTVSSIEKEILSRMSPIPERHSYTISKYGDLGYADLSNQDLVDLLRINASSKTTPDQHSYDGLIVEIIQRMESGHPEYTEDN